MYNFGIIGNCQVSALVDQTGSVSWLCFPRPDSPPVFGSLLDSDGGELTTQVSRFKTSSQTYVRNTNILLTTLMDQEGGKAELVDFCPRFEQNGRMYRPSSLFRVIRPASGTPRMEIKSKPVSGWDKKDVKISRRDDFSVQYDLPRGCLRIYTNMPITYLLEGGSFLLQEEIYLAVLWDSTLDSDIRQTSLDYLSRTEAYWQRWVKHCSIPSCFQSEAIRSALVLKLHCYEDTGAIIAATTTSLPEQLGGQRNWDYRYCWLRDAFFTLSAFYHLSHFDEMEGFLRFLLNIVNFNDDLSPCYTVDRKLPIPEIIHHNWRGYSSSDPVRSNNAAANQVQNDVYGELVLALAPIYLDERFHHLRSDHLDKTISWLAQRCCDSIGKSDSGIWELRGVSQEHSFTNAMCWAGIDRVIRIIENKKLISHKSGFLGALKKSERRARERILAAVRDNVVTNGPADESLDASLLLLPVLRFPDDRLCEHTVHAVAAGLNAGDDLKSHFLYRYLRRDDFGNPQDPFVMCSFWLAHAYARLGKRKEGLLVLETSIGAANDLGLFSEHFSPKLNRQLGNFPQAYSHVGLINAAFAVSPSWQEIL